MNVFGELKKAILENIAASTTTPAATGRIYADITTPTAAVPRFYNGSNWVQLITGNSAGFVTQNSGKAVTVDWSTGLNQQVKLTDSATISFANPQSGQIHNLIITAASANGTFKIYGYKFNMVDQDSRRQAYQPYGQLPNSGSAVYAWFYSAGVKPGYGTVPTATFSPVQPATVPGGIDISLDGKYLLCGQSSSPFSTGYNLFDVMSTYQGVTGYHDIVASTAAAAAVTDIRFTPDGRAAFISTGTTPFLQGWFLDRGKPTGSQFSNPVTLPAGAGGCLAMHPNGQFVGVGHATTPFMSLYPFQGDRYGLKIANPGTLPPSQVVGMDFSPQGDYLAVATQTTPFLTVYTFDQNAASSNIGAFAVPGTLPTAGPASTSTPQCVAWRPQGDFIAMNVNGGAFLYVVPFNRSTGAFGTPLTIPTLSGNATAVRWTLDGAYLIVGTSVTPFLYIFDITSGALVNVTFDSGTAASVAPLGFAVHPSNEYMFVVINGGNGLLQYALPTKVRNYLRINY